MGTCPVLFQVQERHWKVPQCPKWTIVSSGEQRWHKSPKTWGIQWCFEACVWQVWAHITDFYTLLISHDPHPRDGGSAAHTAPVGRTPSRRLTDADLPEMHKWLFFVPPASLQSPWQHMARVHGGIVEAERWAAYDPRKCVHMLHCSGLSWTLLTFSWNFTFGDAKLFLLLGNVMSAEERRNI